MSLLMHKKSEVHRLPKKHAMCPPSTSPHEMFPQQAREISSCSKVEDNIQYSSSTYILLQVCVNV